MKKKIAHITKSNPAWNYLKSAIYKPPVDKGSIIKQDGEFYTKYTKEGDKVFKQVYNRHVHNPKQELTHPKSFQDKEVWNSFQKKISVQSHHRSFSTVGYNDDSGEEHIAEKKLGIEPCITISTSAGDKVVSGISMHKGLVQVNSFKNHGELFCRAQASEFKTISSAHIREGDKALLTDEELQIQCDLYRVKNELYNNLKDEVEVASHFTGLLKINELGKVEIEFSEEGEERPKTDYDILKGRYISMEGSEGNTASLMSIVKKTQASAAKYDIILIHISNENTLLPKNVYDVL